MRKIEARSGHVGRKKNRGLPWACGTKKTIEACLGVWGEKSKLALGVGAKKIEACSGRVGRKITEACPGRGGAKKNRGLPRAQGLKNRGLPQVLINSIDLITGVVL